MQEYKLETNKLNQTYQKDSTANVLIIDNDTETIRFMLEILARKGIGANPADSNKTAIELLEKNNYDMIFIGVTINQQITLTNQLLCSFEILRKIKESSPELPMIILADIEEVKTENQQRLTKSSRANYKALLRLGIQTAVKAIGAGCCDFLIKPLEHETIENLLDTFLPNHNVTTIASAQQGSHWLYQIVGNSPKLIQTVKLAERIAPTSVPVLISGESGTGKELVSFLIHHKSKRAQGPYIKVNCVALSDTLLESELFGHEKGAFTGAYTQRKGRFETAHGGTLLLDEITETPLRFQAKLLRILEQQEFERVGGNENIKVNVRIISTTNKNLLHEVQNGRFRQDLYYRLNVVRLVLSPLRERLADLPELVWHFVNLYARQAQRHVTKLDPVMMDIFTKYHWPGNIRQLRNVVLTSLILGTGPTLSLADVSWLFDELQPLPQEKCNEWVTESTCQSSPNDHLSVAKSSSLGGIPLEQIERQAILDTLRQTAGNQTKAAKVLGISDRTLRDKIRRYRKEKCLQTIQ